MGVNELTDFLSQNWAIILSVFVIITPVNWGILHFLYRNRLHELEARIKTPSPIPSPGNELSIEPEVKRVSLICSTAHHIEKSEEKQLGLRLFYKSLWSNVERTPFGINTCGAEPFRSILFDYYVNELRTSSQSHMTKLNKRVRWYWFPGDAVGLNYEPAFFESQCTSDAEDRTAKEMAASDVIVAFAGRTGTRDQVERLIQCHYDAKSEIDLSRKPLILLAWFGGTVKDYIDENKGSISWLLDKYPELRPSEQFDDWFKGELPKKLAEQLVRTIQRLMR